MNKLSTSLFLSVISVIILPFCCTSCSSSSGTASGDEFDSEAYREYVGSKEVQSDLELFYEFAVKSDNLKMSIILAMSDDEKFFNDEVDEDEAKGIYTLMGEILEKASEYEDALLRLENSGYFTTKTPTALKKTGLEGMATVKAGKDFLDACRGAGQTVRERTMEIFLSDGVKSDDNRKALYEELPKELRKGASDYKEWWKNFNAGEYDASSGNIFNAFITGNSRASEDFLAEAADRGYTNTTNILKVAPQLIEAGFNLIVEASGNILPDAMGLGVSIGTNAVLVGEILVKATGKKISEVSSEVAAGILNMIPGFGDVKGTVDLIPTAEELKHTASAVANYIGDKINSYSDPTQVDVARISYDDEDGTEAKTLVAINQESGEITLSLGSMTDNSVSANLPEGNYIITAIDEEGDKFTEEVSLEVGDIIEKTIKTNESEILEKLASSSSTRFNNDEKSSSSRKQGFDFDDESSSSAESRSSESKPGSDSCDPYELGQEGYMSCLFLGTWKLEEMRITCDNNSTYDPEKEGDYVTWTFNEDETASIIYDYSDGSQEREDYSYSVNLFGASGKLTLNDGENVIDATITSLGDEGDGTFYLGINVAFTSPESGDECYQNYSFTR